MQKDISWRNREKTISDASTKSKRCHKKWQRRILLIILANTFRFGAFLCLGTIRKAVQTWNKNSSFKSTLLIPTESTSAFHSTNSCCCCFFFLVLSLFPLTTYPYRSLCKPHTTHNFLILSEGELTLPTPAFNFFPVAKSPYQLSCEIQMFLQGKLPSVAVLFFAL